MRLPWRFMLSPDVATKVNSPQPARQPEYWFDDKAKRSRHRQ